MLNKSNARVGVYVDAENIRMNGGFGMQFDVLREFACRGDAEAVRLNSYVSYDSTRANTDRAYHTKINNFYFSLRDFGYKVIRKNVRWYTDENGNRYGKANADLDMAVDALMQSENLDRVLLATGDGDFVQVVKALQNKGCRVEIVAFDNVSSDLRREADMFISGYLIPNLLPAQYRGERVPWAEVGSRVRGHCYHHRADQDFGFMRFLKKIAPGLWITDTRNSNSPYETAFFHNSQLPSDVNPAELPSRNLFFEFDLVEASKGDGIQCQNIQLASRL